MYIKHGPTVSNDGHVTNVLRFVHQGPNLCIVSFAILFPSFLVLLNPRRLEIALWGQQNQPLRL